MNPTLVKVGFTVLIGAALLFAKWWNERNRDQQSSYSDMSYGNYDGSNTTVCYICLQDFNNFEKNFISLPCKHKYHRECIGLVFKEISSKRRCPVCRREVPNSFMSEVSLI